MWVIRLLLSLLAMCTWMALLECAHVSWGLRFLLMYPAAWLVLSNGYDPKGPKWPDDGGP